MNRLTVIIVAVVVCIIVSLGWAVNHYRDNVTEYKKQCDEKTQVLSLANATIIDMTTRQRDVAVLDAKYMKEPADAKKQLDDSQCCVRDGKCGLRINAKCPANGATSTGSMGDVPGPRLTDSTQRGYFTPRERVVTMTKQVGYLQDYINTQCRRFV